MPLKHMSDSLLSSSGTQSADLRLRQLHLQLSGGPDDCRRSVRPAEGADGLTAAAAAAAAKEEQCPEEEQALPVFRPVTDNSRNSEVSTAAERAVDGVCIK